MTLLTAPGGSVLTVGTNQPILEARSFLTYKNWPLTFADDFDTLRLLQNGDDSPGWYPRFSGGGYFPPDYNNLSPTGLPGGGFSTLGGEFEMYIDPLVPELAQYSAFSLGNSTLKITMSNTPSELLFYPDRWQPFVSGCMVSRNAGVGWSQRFGYFEARIKLPAGYGTWPAFWMLTTDGNWPPEIDILERFAYAPQDTVSTTVHTRSATPGYGYNGLAWYPDGPPHYAQGYTFFHSNESDPSNGFHLYGVEWTPEHIDFYYDRQLVVSMITPDDLKDRPMYLIVNMAATYDSTTWPNLAPVTMELDWIRVWGMPPAPVPPIDGPTPWDGGWDTPAESVWDGGISIWDNG